MALCVDKRGASLRGTAPRLLGWDKHRQTLTGVSSTSTQASQDPRREPDRKGFALHATAPRRGIAATYGSIAHPFAGSAPLLGDPPAAWAAGER